MSLFGVLVLAGFCLLAAFQLALAAGAPLGALAWGGRFRVLPGRLRWASLAVAGLAALGVVIVMQITGAGPRILPEIWLRPALGAFAAVFAMSLFANAASPSKPERFHGVALGGTLVLACGGLVFGGG